MIKVREGLDLLRKQAQWVSGDSPGGEGSPEPQAKPLNKDTAGGGDASEGTGKLRRGCPNVTDENYITYLAGENHQHRLR